MMSVAEAFCIKRRGGAGEKGKEGREGGREKVKGERLREGEGRRQGGWEMRRGQGARIGMCNSAQSFHLRVRYSRQIRSLILLLIKKNLHFTN